MAEENRGLRVNCRVLSGGSCEWVEGMGCPGGEVCSGNGLGTLDSSQQSPRHLCLPRTQQFLPSDTPDGPETPTPEPSGVLGVHSELVTVISTLI